MIQKYLHKTGYGCRKRAGIVFLEVWAYIFFSPGCKTFSMNTFEILTKVWYFLKSQLNAISFILSSVCNAICLASCIRRFGIYFWVILLILY